MKTRTGVFATRLCASVAALQDAKFNLDEEMREHVRRTTNESITRHMEEERHYEVWIGPVETYQNDLVIIHYEQRYGVFIAHPWEALPGEAVADHHYEDFTLQGKPYPSVRSHGTLFVHDGYVWRRNA